MKQELPGAYKPAPLTKEPLNKSTAALDGPFAATFRFENLEIHKVFPRFSNLNLRQNLSTTALADLFRASLEFNKKLYKLFIAPKVRQILYKSAQRALARCECAQHAGFLIKSFNQESVSILILDGVIVDDHTHLRQRCNLLDFCSKGIDLYQKRAGGEAFYILNALMIINIYIGQLRQSLQH